MATRYSERIRKNEEKKYVEVLRELRNIMEIFKTYNYVHLTTTEIAKEIKKVYAILLKNIVLFHKFCSEKQLKQLFDVLINKGYEILHSKQNNKSIEKIIGKPIFKMVNYIHKYYEKMHQYNIYVSRVSDKLTNKLNNDVSKYIFEYLTPSKN